MYVCLHRQSEDKTVISKLQKAYKQLCSKIVIITIIIIMMIIIIITIIMIIIITKDARYNVKIVCYRKETSIIWFYSFFLLLYIPSHHINPSLFEMFVLNWNNSTLLIKLIFIPNLWDLFYRKNKLKPIEIQTYRVAQGCDTIASIK